jgi:hypothetical protein
MVEGVVVVNASAPAFEAAVQLWVRGRPIGVG